MVNGFVGLLTTETLRKVSAQTKETAWKKPFNQPARQAERVLAPGDGEAKPGAGNLKHVQAHEVGDR